MALKNKLIIVLIAALLVSTYAEEEFKFEKDVLVLTSQNFEAAVNKYEYLLVEFYAPWCGHCKTLLPEYQKAAKTLAQNEPQIMLAKVDATEEKELAEQFNVEGFPTLKWFNKQKDSEYQGGRTESEIVSWCQKKVGPSIIQITEESQLQSLQSEHQALFVLFSKVADQKISENYNSLASGHDDVAFAYTTLPSLVNQYSNGFENRVVAFKQFDVKQVELTSEFTEDNMEAADTFVSQNELPTIMEFNERAAEKIFGDSSSGMIVMYAAGCPVSQKARDALREISEQVKGYLLLSESVINEGLGERLGEFMGVTDKDLPAIRIVTASQDDIKKYHFTEEVNAANLLAFAENWKAGTLKPVFKSEEIPEKNDGPVKVVVGKNWETLVMDKTKDVLVEFYAPWCGHCKTLAPIYEQLGKQLANNPNIIIAKCDATLNDIDGQNIQGFPTLKLYTSKDKAGQDYDGERDLKGMLEYLEKNTTFDWVKTDEVQAETKEEKADL